MKNLTTAGNGSEACANAQTTRVVARWLDDSQQRLNSALRSGDRRSIEAAYAALEEVKDAVRVVTLEAARAA